MNIPDDRKYQDSHEWVLIEGNTAAIGISDYAQESLGDIVFVELPETGDEFAKGDEIATIESVKAASPIYAPVGGKVIEVNGDLEDTPEAINQDPYNAFLVKLEIADEGDADDLLDAAGYQAVVEAQED